ncbi:MAG TPA: hypothetical protein VGD37_10255 [Kofleriaceae bacterium]|jgi:hypothetical protein
MGQTQESRERVRGQFARSFDRGPGHDSARQDRELKTLPMALAGSGREPAGTQPARARGPDQRVALLVDAEQLAELPLEIRARAAPGPAGQLGPDVHRPLSA